MSKRRGLCRASAIALPNEPAHRGSRALVSRLRPCCSGWFCSPAPAFCCFGTKAGRCRPNGRWPRAAGLVVTVEPARVDPANEGKLVHVNGEVKAVAPLRDPEFRVAVTGLRLIRTVEMYQWKAEKHTERHTTLGGSEDSSTTYTYHLTWNGSRIDSSHFRRPERRFARPE